MTPDSIFNLNVRGLHSQYELLVCIFFFFFFTFLHLFKFKSVEMLHNFKLWLCVCGVLLTQFINSDYCKI